MRDFLLVLLCLLVSACQLEEKIQEVDIYTVKLGDQIFYVPKYDFKFQGPNSKNTHNMLIRVMYPEMTPILESPGDIWKRGEWHRKLLILVDFAPKGTDITKFAENRLDHFRTTKFVGEEYGFLHHYTQAKGGIADHHDVWIEKDDGEINSVIDCSEKLTSASVPQCSQHIRPLPLTISVNYNKRLLKEAPHIRERVLKLLESYDRPENAVNYYKVRLNGE